jgi:hypothetical protein
MLPSLHRASEHLINAFQDVEPHGSSARNTEERRGKKRGRCFGFVILVQSKRGQSWRRRGRDAFEPGIDRPKQRTQC